MAVSIIGNALLQGLGKGRESMILAFIRFGFFLWTPLLILPKYYGLYGAWGSFPISDICGTITSSVFMARAIRELRRSDPTTPLTHINR
jgi:Na+-driven multidrug efflux pump